MSKYNEILTRKIKDEFGYFPNLPLEKPLKLGKIGLFNGRSAIFDWQTSLEELGIIDVEETIDNQPQLNNLFLSASGINCIFEGNDALTNKASVTFNFKKKNALVTQGFNMTLKNLRIRLLENKLNDKIKNEGLDWWNPEYLILTGLFVAEGFTILFSREKESKITIETGIPLPPNISREFNIADITLSLSVKNTVNSFYRNIALNQISPYFYVHKLIYDKKKKECSLKLYS